MEAADPPSTKGAGGEMKTWNAQQLKAFLASAMDERFSPVFHLLAMTGMRRGEACGLRWDDVDLAAIRLHDLRRGRRSPHPDVSDLL